VFFYWSHSCIIFVSMVLHWRGEAREDLCTSTAVTREAPLTRTLLISRYTGHSGQGETWRCILELQRHCAGPTPRGVAFMTSVNIHTHTPLIWAVQYLLNQFESIHPLFFCDRGMWKWKCMMQKQCRRVETHLFS